MAASPSESVYDFVIIGSGFGGSVSAMRLAEKGYRVLLLERGKRWRDEDFPTTNWIVWKYLWLPMARCFGILQFSFFKDVLVLHGSGVGGGSLGYANVLMEPDARALAAPEWKQPIDWQATLRPHYATARRMLGVTRNPRAWPADIELKAIATELGRAATYHPTDVGVFFGQPAAEGQEVPDPFFNGDGPPRRGCNHCGGCMVGCRNNAKNTLVKNYLYFAEKWGVEVRAEAEARDVRPLPPNQPDGARYEVIYRNPTAFWKPEQRTRARNVIFAAGTLGTLRLLFRCREITRSLSKLSPRLGEKVRTNSEAIIGSANRTLGTDYSKGIAITSIFNADEVTAIEPVRYPEGSDLIHLLAGPLINSGNFAQRILKALGDFILHPRDFFTVHIAPGWAKRSTILLVMQTEDNQMHLKLGRHLLTLFQRGLVSQTDPLKPIPAHIPIGHHVTRQFAQRTNGIPLGSINEGLFKIPVTAHILGGCAIGQTDQEGVVNLDCQIHNYPGLYVVDGSIVPANPGVNPSLTITAMAEYILSQIKPRTP